MKGEVKEETKPSEEEMDTSAAPPAALAGTVMEVTKGKEFKVLNSYVKLIPRLTEFTFLLLLQPYNHP